LYDVTVELLDADGGRLDMWKRRVGLRTLRLERKKDQWGETFQFSANGVPFFAKGANWIPPDAIYSRFTARHYREILDSTAAANMNMLRIWGGGVYAEDEFYDLCDELGLMVWQEFPLTSSGLENWPPEDEQSIGELSAIAASFIERRRHHVSLLMWGGGNEQMGDLEGRKTGMGKPCDLSHPMLRRLGEVVRKLDPTRRYVPTSPYGPRAHASPTDFGKGLHWAVHSGAAMWGLAEAEQYWAADDALFRPEVYCPGASPVELIERYAGDFATFPATTDNPYWTRLTTWWLDWPKLVAIHGREPRDLAEYVAWSQANQATMMAGEMKACKDRFPRCGGVLMWSGHDTFPLSINSSLIDFEGNLKPAALAVSAVWQARTEHEA
ncbi:MAG: glycoside hydrolase family 2 TIM barrel-domain containing protein, partial [Armatimonadota bacterium]